MALKSFTLVASLLALASASPCKPSKPAYALPTTGTGTQLPGADSGLKVLKIAVGHGIQNYTCADSSSPTVATGALAVLYDITDLYPGTIKTGLSAEVFSSISVATLWGQDIPLNLQTPGAEPKVAKNAAAAYTEVDYGADVADPFPSASDLSLPSITSSPIPFLGHHYFDAAGIPTFDLSTAGLFGSMAKNANVKAPATADTGILATGAVDWLQLIAKDNGLSVGIKLVYRVITAGGASETCATLDAAAGSVPYTAFYWFFG